jgi:hypothetical protein
LPLLAATVGEKLPAIYCVSYTLQPLVLLRMAPKGKRVMVHSDRNVTHVCVYEVGSEDCIVCGAKSKDAGQKPLAVPDPIHKVVAAQLKKAKVLPTNKKQWSSKPHNTRLVCVCLVCLLLATGVSIIGWVIGSADTNECDARPSVCSQLANCTNFDDSYSCKCLPGYAGTGDADVEDYLGDGGSIGCRDINECAVAPPSVPDRGSVDDAPPPPPPVCEEDQICVNTPGSYRCV